VTAVHDPRTDPGMLRTVEPSDLLHLVTRPSRTHLGFPPGVDIDFPIDGIPHPRLLPDKQKLRAGDVYLFPFDSLVSHALGVPGFVPNLVEDALLLLGKVASAEALNVVGLVPLAWTVPTRQETQVPVPGHVRLTFSGVFGTASAPLEIWSWGLNAAMPAGTPDQAALDAGSAAMHDTYVTNLKQVMPGNVVLTQCLYALVGPDGHILRNADGSFRQSKHAQVEAGANGSTSPLPLQTALAISYGTARPGASGRGRSFLPFQDGTSIDPDFRISTATTQNYATRMGHVVFQLNAIGTPCVVASSKGYLSPITTVRVGKVPDTMRSRRDRLIEGYIAGSISAP
jgi:hypothetical protein